MARHKCKKISSLGIATIAVITDNRGMNLRPLLPPGVAYLMLALTLAPAAPAPKSRKTVPPTGGAGGSNPGSTGPKTPPHHDQGR